MERVCPECGQTKGFRVVCVGEKIWERVERQYVKEEEVVLDDEGDEYYEEEMLYKDDYGHYYIDCYEGGFDDDFDCGPEDSWEADENVTKAVIVKCMCGLEALAEAFEVGELANLDLTNNDAVPVPVPPLFYVGRDVIESTRKLQKQSTTKTVLK